MSPQGAGRRTRYYASTAPRCDPHAQPTDGLDAVLVNGVELGGAHRARLRTAVAQQKERERARAFFGGEDERL